MLLTDTNWLGCVIFTCVVYYGISYPVFVFRKFHYPSTWDQSLERPSFSCIEVILTLTLIDLATFKIALEQQQGILPGTLGCVNFCNFLWA